MYNHLHIAHPSCPGGIFFQIDIVGLDIEIWGAGWIPMVGKKDWEIV